MRASLCILFRIPIKTTQQLRSFSPDFIPWRNLIPRFSRETAGLRVPPLPHVLNARKTRNPFHWSYKSFRREGDRKSGRESRGRKARITSDRSPFIKRLLSGRVEAQPDGSGSLFYIRAAYTTPGIIPGAKLTDVKFERKAFNPRPASDGVPTGRASRFSAALCDWRPINTAFDAASLSPPDSRFIAESTTRNIPTREKPRD